jgi:hypothetical protein
MPEMRLADASTSADIKLMTHYRIARRTIRRRHSDGEAQGSDNAVTINIAIVDVGNPAIRLDG